MLLTVTSPATPTPAQDTTDSGMRRQIGSECCRCRQVPAGVSAVPLQTWHGRSLFRCRCGRGEPSPDADVAGFCTSAQAGAICGRLRTRAHWLHMTAGACARRWVHVSDDGHAEARLGHQRSRLCAHNPHRHLRRTEPTAAFAALAVGPSCRQSTSGNPLIGVGTHGTQSTQRCKTSLTWTGTRLLGRAPTERAARVDLRRCR